MKPETCFGRCGTTNCTCNVGDPPQIKYSPEEIPKKEAWFFYWKTQTEHGGMLVLANSPKEAWEKGVRATGKDAAIVDFHKV